MPREEIRDKEYTIGKILSEGNKAAILAKPGGGKSALIRRLALAYAYPARKKEVDDRLPDESWFPVYIRCRDLGKILPGSREVTADGIRLLTLMKRGFISSALAPCADQ